MGRCLAENVSSLVLVTLLDFSKFGAVDSPCFFSMFGAGDSPCFFLKFGACGTSGFFQSLVLPENRKKCHQSFDLPPFSLLGHYFDDNL